ncbi:unnamed protein product [Diplocarpon coronariae]
MDCQTYDIAGYFPQDWAEGLEPGCEESQKQRLAKHTTTRRDSETEQSVLANFEDYWESRFLGANYIDKHGVRGRGDGKFPDELIKFVVELSHLEFGDDRVVELFAQWFSEP